MSRKSTEGPRLTLEELTQNAYADYGDLITRIVVWPGGDIQVHLVGGMHTDYLPDGTRLALRTEAGARFPSTRFFTRGRWLWRAVRGVLSLDGKPGGPASSRMGQPPAQ